MRLAFTPASAPAALDAAPRATDLPTMVADLRALPAPRAAGTPQARFAAEHIKAALDAIGGWDTHIETVRGVGDLTGRELHNVVAERTGTAPDAQRGIIVGGAHLDTVPGSPGANDDGTGVVTLLQAARTLATAPTRHDVKLVFFDGEELGLLGASAYVRAHAADHSRTLLMVEAEMLASPKGHPMLLFGRGTDARTGARIVAAAQRLGVPLEVSKDRPYGSDHNRFDDVGVPAMVVTTTAPPASRILHDDPAYHSPRDTVEHLDQARLGQMAELFVTSLRDAANAPVRPLTIDA